MITDTHSTSTLAARRPDAEQPLTGPARLLLIVAATTITLVFYLGCVLALLFTVAVLAVDVIALMGAVRFGLHRRMAAPVKAMNDLARLVARGLWIDRGVDYTLSLRPEEAPGLFAMVERLAQEVGAPLPKSIQLAMTANAWVQLRGYRQGRGHCTLAVGYDYLATLPQSELAAIIAHEMAHAKLVQRGFWGWLGPAIERMRRLHADLAALNQTCRGKRQRFFTAELLLAGTTFLGRLASRWAALYSRQDEFAADHLAAEVCGTKTYRAMLMSVSITALKGEDVRWRDRLAQSQREDGFSQWLRSRLVPRDEGERRELERRALCQGRVREFDTHPTLPDRLAALPECPLPTNSMAPALALLREPDELATRLLTELERIAAEQERRDTEQRQKQANNHRRGRNLTGGQALGAALVVACGIPTLLALGALLIDLISGQPSFGIGNEIGLASAAGSLTSLGFFALRRFARKEILLLPVPPISHWQAAIDSAGRSAPVSEWGASLEAQMLGELIPSMKGKQARARFWQDRCYRALQECDYQRALIAAQLCLKADAESLAGLLGHGISAAYFGQNKEAGQSLSRALSAYGLGPSVSWAIGWAHCLWGNWDKGETFLLDAIDRRPKEARLWSLLASCQWRQGKMREALQNLRRAVSLEPEETRHRISLTRALLATGRPREASKELEILEQTAGTDFDVMLGAVRARLLLGRTEEATRRAESLREEHPGTQTLFGLAQSYAEAHLPEPARDYYEQLCRSGFFPEAWVGLAGIAQDCRDYAAARGCLRSALDVTREPDPDASKPLDLLEVVCAKLAAMNEPVDDCQAWTATIDMSPSPAPVWRLSLLVCDTTLEKAQDQVRWLYQAMHPGQELSDAQVTWELVAPDDQPDGPTAPGIYQHRLT